MAAAVQDDSRPVSKPYLIFVALAIYFVEMFAV